MGQNCHGQKISCLFVPRVTSILPSSLYTCRLRPARLLCQGASPGKNTGACWPRLVSIPSRALYFLLPELPAPLRTWCCQNPCYPISCMASAPGPQGANPSPPGQPQEQTPGDGPHAEVKIKPQLKPRGGVAKEEDLKPSHQLYKLQVKSARSTRQTLRLWNI